MPPKFITAAPTTCACGCGQIYTPKASHNHPGLTLFARGHSLGYVHASTPPVTRFWAKVQKTETCWLWTDYRDKHGYGRIEATVDGKHRPSLAHRVSWEIHNGPIPDGMCVLHRCDRPACVRPEHLFLGTMFDNTADMMAKGRKNCARGESAGSNKLTEAQVTEIRRLYAAGGHSYPSLGRRYGVAQSSIYGIINRRTWAHVA